MGVDWYCEGGGGGGGGGGTLPHSNLDLIFSLVKTTQNILELLGNPCR